MSRRHQTHLFAGTRLRYNLAKVFFIGKARGKHNLCHKLQCLRKLAAKHLGTHLKTNSAGILLAIQTIEIYIGADATGVEINLGIQTAVAVGRGIHIAEQCL